MSASYSSLYSSPLIKLQKSAIQRIYGLFEGFSDLGKNFIFWSFRNWTAFLSNEHLRGPEKIYIGCFFRSLDK